MCSADHPDHGWIGRARDALDWWEASPAASPTSSVLGGGAVAATEAAFSEMHAGRPALLLPSGSYALRIGLLVIGVRAGDEVLCAGIDWPSGFAAVTSLGATPVPVAVDEETLTIDPVAAARARTGRTRAVIACHLHGICADVPALRRSLPGLAILEDAAQALGCSLDGRLAGTLGDVAALSLGPGKTIDAGEGGVLLCGDADLHERAVAAACHPLRQLLTGIPVADPGALAMRPHPMAAVLALHQLAGWDPQPEQVIHAQKRQLLSALECARPLGDPLRHASAEPYVPVLLDADATTTWPDTRPWTPSGAQIMPGLPPGEEEYLTGLLARIRLANCLDRVVMAHEKPH
jgi:hypothetical protein